MDDGAATENHHHADAGLRDGMPPAACQTPRADAAPAADRGSGLSRREVLVGAGGTGLLAAVGAGALRAPAASAAAGTWTRAAADAVEDATWSAMRDPATGYGVAVFDLEPGQPGGETSITVTYYHAVGADPANPGTGAAGAPNPDYTPFETFTLVRPRSDGHGQRGQAAATGTVSHAG
jgi:hypothetical protein